VLKWLWAKRLREVSVMDYLLELMKDCLLVLVRKWVLALPTVPEMLHFVNTRMRLIRQL
jgi:hypothetical protein